MKLGYKTGLLMCSSLLMMAAAAPVAHPQEWTQWRSLDTPDGEGDEETLEKFLAIGDACAEPANIECRLVERAIPASEIGQDYTCDPQTGGICLNHKQSDGACLDYEVRFDCAVPAAAIAPDAAAPDPIVPDPGFPLWWIGAAVAGVAGLGLLMLRGSRGRAPASPTPTPTTPPSMVPVNTAPVAVVKKKVKHPPPAGLPFPNSPMQPVGSGTSAQASTLSGPYAVLEPAFKATGRIGFAQIGVPSADDIAFGTGFLISDRHVLTNRHVYEFYREHLEGEGGGGIEFYAEKGSDASEFARFSGAPPILPEGFDLAIFELAAPITNRPPIAIKPVPTESIADRDIVVIGYPCPPEVTEEIAQVVEPDPIFGVKRLSEGKVFRHSSDTDTKFGVDASVSQVIAQTGRMNAICHTASTLGGSSGSPVLDKASGDLVGIHFGFDVAFQWAERSNFAIPVSDIVEALKLGGLMK